MGTFKQICIGVIIGLIVDGIVLGVPFIFNYIGLNSPFNLLLVETPIWVSFLIVAILIPTIIMVLSVRWRSKDEPMVGIFRGRPEGDVFTLRYNYEGVKWRVLYGRANRYIRSEPYSFCESNPECPKCECEMEAEKRGVILRRYHWKCDRCETFYRCPTKHPFDAHQVVERLVEADVRSGRLKLQD